jgi:hypothetical protein
MTRTAWIAVLPDERGVERPLANCEGGILTWHGADEAAVRKLPNAPRADARITRLLTVRDTTSACGRVQLLRREADAILRERGTPYLGTAARAWKVLAEKAIALAGMLANGDGA